MLPWDFLILLVFIQFCLVFAYFWFRNCLYYAGGGCLEIPTSVEVDWIFRISGMIVYLTSELIWWPSLNIHRHQLCWNTNLILSKKLRVWFVYEVGFSKKKEKNMQVSLKWKLKKINQVQLLKIINQNDKFRK